MWRLLVALAAVASLAGVSACGGNGDDEGRQAGGPAAEQPQGQRRPAGTPGERKARSRRIARARRRALARRRAEARERRRQVRAQQRALARSRPENAPGDDCAEGYDPCVPPYPPDVDCAELSGPYRVSPPDPHRLDPDGDGKAC